MVVGDIANGSEVKIYAAISGHSIVLITEAIFGVSAGLLVKPMEYFGKYMQLLEPSQVQVKNKRDGRIYKFISTTITPVKTRYGYFHLIRCSSKLEPENSRRAERFHIEKLGLMSINGDKTYLHNCIVYDISMRGVAIILDNSTTCKPGDNVDLMFHYGDTLHSYELNTVVVRNFMLHDKNAVGCSISNLNVDIIGLLSAKKNEKYNSNTSQGELNPNINIPKEQQIKEVEEDIAKGNVPKQSHSLTISSNGTNPLDPANLEHITDKTLRQKKKEEKMAQQAREIENLLDLKDI